MNEKKRKALKKEWGKYLKDSRLPPEEQEKRASLFARRGEKPPPRSEW
jgi:hypothetical protein